MDWSRAGIVGGIPNRTTVCATLNPGATAAQINSAIQSCPSGQVVKLSAGTYNLSSGITFNNKSNVTLRGAGADQTKLVFGGSSAISCHGLYSNLCIDSADTNWPGGPSNTASWTAGYAKGTTQITLSNTAGLSPGDPLILDQLDDSTDTGGIYVCQTVAARCNDDGPNGGPSGGQRQNRAQQQLVTVTAVSGNQVTISPGLYMPNWRASQNPGAWWASTPVFGSGVEDLSLDHTASDEQAGITLFNCSGCWVSGIRSVNSNREHVWIYLSPRTVVRDSYFFGTKNAVSQSYGVECYPSSDSLIENNIFQHITAPQMINAACSGTVVAYNFSINDYYTASPAYLMQAAWMHAGGIDNLLLEGNVGAGMYSDLFHGSHHFVTLFRNRYNGSESGKTDHLLPVALHPFSRFYNIVGNVFGEAGKQNSYQDTPSINASKPIYELGTGTVNISVNDPTTVSTLMRWGNYDVVNGSTLWNPGEVPSAGAFANPLPSSNALPPSFYLSAKPSWWGSTPWPAIGPDVTGGTGPGGHSYPIPAQKCYSNVMGGPADGTGPVLSFNADSCYGSTGGGGGSALDPPSGVTAVPH